MTDKTDSKERVTDEMVHAALKAKNPTLYRDHLRHPSNGPVLRASTEKEIQVTRKMLEAALGASLAASAGSEPVAYAMFADNGNIRLWSKARIPHPDAKPLYLHPSPPEGAVAEQALLRVLDVTRRYLPPDGPSAHDAMSEIIAIVDPWPLGPLEQ